jgi:peroxiredoxin
MLLAVGFLARRILASREPDAFLLRAGDPVPDVRLAAEAGADTTLAAVTAGRPTVVVLHAPTCAPCDAQVDAAVAAASRIPAARRPAVVALSVEVPDRAAFAARHPGVPLYADVERSFAPRYGLRKLPAAFTLGADRRVRGSLAGHHPLGDVHALVGGLR